jgi:uncharacterized protein (DUF433 family)
MNDSNKVIRAFSADHVSCLTGLSIDQLTEWDRMGFFHPEHASEDRGEAYSRIYSFQDLVGLKTLAVLRKVHKVPLWHLKEVAKELEQHVKRPWSEVTLYVLKKRVQFTEPSSGLIRGVKDGQYVLIPLENVADEMRQQADKLRERPAAKIGRIERHRFVAHNAWVVAGTRIPVRAIRQFAAAGYSIAEIIKEYPSLKEEDVRAALSQSVALTA